MLVESGEIKVYVSGVLIGTAENIKINLREINLQENYKEPKKKGRGKMKKIYVGQGTTTNRMAMAAIETMAKNTCGNLDFPLISEDRGKGKGRNKGINRKYPVIKNLKR